MESRIRELIRQEAETGYIGRPAVSRRLKRTDRHLQGVAWFGSLNKDGPRYWIDLTEIENRQVFERRFGSELPTG